MHPEHELDALISGQPGSLREPASAELAPLLAVMRRLEPLRAAEPAPDFARVLESQLLARVDVLAAQSVTPRPLARRAAIGAGRRPAAPPRRRWLVWQTAVAAALILLVCSGATLRAAASAAPGSALYGLRGVEQNVRAQLAGSDAARARLHLQYASDALNALTTAVARHEGIGAYRDALATMRSELAAASDALARVPDGAEHSDIATQLDQFSAHAQSDLFALLPGLGWTDRVAITTALGALGAHVPQVTSATLISERGASGPEWRITLSGSGFEPGATPLFNGQPLAAALTITPTKAEALVENPPGAHIISLGIGNPDGTAALTTNIQTTGIDGGHGHPPTGTPGNNGDHGQNGSNGTATPGDQSGGPPGNHNGHDGTSTPSATETPSPRLQRSIPR